MSGPKYYNFPVSSAQEAAGIYAQLSSFQSGVRVRVVNNELQFTVSNNAWYAGATYSAISERVNSARARYAENEEMRRILRERRTEEKKKIQTKKSDLENAYRREKARLEAALSQCSAIDRQAQTRVETPFGSYGLPAESKAVKETVQTITTRLSTLDAEYRSALNKCDDSLSSIDRCDALQELTKIQRKYSALSISESTVDRDVEKLNDTIQSKLKTLKRFVGFLEELYHNMQNKDLSGYFERIKSEVSQIDIFDNRASEKINAILTQIEKEISALREREKQHQESDEIRKNVNAQIEVLCSLKDSLQPVIESIEDYSSIRADYTETAKKTIEECSNVISVIESLEFISGERAGQIDRIKNQLNNLSNSLMSESTVNILQDILRELHETEKACQSDNDIYTRFKTEQERYLELYIKLQGVLSAEGSELSDEALEVIIDPSAIMLVYGNPEEQITKLKELNEQLSDRLGECFQNGVCAAFSASVEQSSWGAKFKQEKHKDGSLHMAYVRKVNKGAIFDVSCTQDGKVGVFPRGVVLCNGKTTITPEELKTVHSSCAWADEITDKIHGFGIEGTTYEEMPEADLAALYDTSNYYHIETLEESKTFLRLSGYSEAEIEALLAGADEQEHANEQEQDDTDSKTKEKRKEVQYRSAKPNK